ncbi:MAG: DUF4142 domain-containing protein [Pirellulaceae bacterium]|nr:DUF4142 domain-containing protein [Pirellulaceae bacterium]
MSMGKFQKISLALLCTANMGISASAQNPVNSQPATAQDGRVAQPGGAAHDAGQHQSMMASCVVYDNQAEVALGRMAQEKSQSGAVKKFAGMMVQEHQELLTKFQKFAPNTGELYTGELSNKNRDPSITKERSEAVSQTKQNPNNQDQPNVGNSEAQTNLGKPNAIAPDAVKLQKELAQQCLSDTQAKLSKEDGGDFDKCYVGMQIAKHAGMKSKLTVFSRHASGEFKQLVDQAIQSTGEHLAKAELLMAELDEDTDAPNSSNGRTKRAAAVEKTEKR